MNLKKIPTKKLLDMGDLYMRGLIKKTSYTKARDELIRRKVIKDMTK